MWLAAVRGSRRPLPFVGRRTGGFPRHFRQTGAVWLHRVGRAGVGMRECAIKSSEQGAREGAPFIHEHMIEVTAEAFDPTSPPPSRPRPSPTACPCVVVVPARRGSRGCWPPRPPTTTGPLPSAAGDTSAALGDVCRRRTHPSGWAASHACLAVVHRCKVGPL